MNEVRSKVIVITGASKGIGKALAVNFSNLGANIALISRNVELMESFADQLNENYLILGVDISDENAIQKAIEKVIQQYGHIDVLINNAGYVEPLSLLETSIEIWEKTLAVNLTGTFICTKEVVKYMKKTGGKIINVSSTAGLSARPGWSAYAAAKAGVINFSASIAEELRNYGIKVFTICPGRTATDLRKKLAPNEDPTSIMQPKAVVDIIKYCISHHANVLEGQPILIRDRK